MNAGDWITLGGFVVAAVALALPPWLEYRRFRGSTAYRLEAFLETSKLCVDSLKLDDPQPNVAVPNDRSTHLRSQASGLLELLAENGDRIERKLRKAQRQDPGRKPERFFHLMLSDLQTRLENPVSKHDLLFSYYTGAVAALLVGAKSLRREALQIAHLAQSDPFFKEVVMNVLPTRIQKKISQAAP
jgi:hypothetical protein